MSDLISRDALYDAISDIASSAHHDVMSVKDILRNIEAAPAVDAVPVVRCRDCKYCAVCGNGLHVCKAHDLHLLRTTPDGYCHMGAKMDGGAEE